MLLLIQHCWCKKLYPVLNAQIFFSCVQPPFLPGIPVLFKNIKRAGCKKWNTANAKKNLRDDFFGVCCTKIFFQAFNSNHHFYQVCTSQYFLRITNIKKTLKINPHRVFKLNFFCSPTTTTSRLIFFQFTIIQISAVSMNHYVRNPHHTENQIQKTKLFDESICPYVQLRNVDLNRNPHRVFKLNFFCSPATTTTTTTTRLIFFQ